MTKPHGAKSRPAAATLAGNAGDAVRELLDAVVAFDADRLAAAVTEDLLYENVSLPTIRGRRTLQTLARRWFAMRGAGFDYRIHRIAIDGSTVMTERSDVLVLGRLRMQFWVMGVFEVRDGKVSAWRDYFDYGDMTVGLLRGIAGAIVPALGRRFR